jgi:hypothetical protein
MKSLRELFRIGKGPSGVLVGGNLCTFAPNVGSRADATKGKALLEQYP